METVTGKKSATQSARRQRLLEDFGKQGRAEVERGLYYGILAGPESARIKEDGFVHKLDIPLDGLGGTTVFGYGLPLYHGYYFAVEGFFRT